MTVHTMKSTHQKWHFKIAASMAFKEGMKKADPVIKEPIMLVNVIVPDEYLGFVIGDLSSRRGMVRQQESRSGGVTQVTADVPLAEMFGYATVLRFRYTGTWTVLNGTFTLQRSSEVCSRKDYERTCKELIEFYTVSRIFPTSPFKF